MLIHSPRELGILIKNQRKKLGLTQKEIGNLVGLKQKTISAIENNPEHTKLNTLFKVLSALETEVHLFSKDALNKMTTQWKDEW